MREIRFFKRDRARFAYLSNFYPSPITINGREYPTVEHFYQASKALRPEDHDRIARAATPAEAKRLGRKVALRADWDKVKDDIMYAGIKAKFERQPQLLLQTGCARLVEDSPFDSYWGTGRDGRGKNRLGELLMKLRSELARREEMKADAGTVSSRL
jgi:hypothetical protein